MAFYRSPGDYTHFVQAESAYGTSPGALAGTDAFRSRTASLFEQVVERLDRDEDGDGLVSVLTTQLGRQSGTFDTDECDFVPSGNASTPTPPDMGAFFKTHLGQELIGLAHTTVIVGSTTTLLKLAAGGGAISGIAAGMMVAVEVTTGAYEVREVTNVAIDDVTIAPALSGAPATGRAVKVGITYRIDGTVFGSLYLWEFLAQGNNFRQAMGGAIPQEMKLACDWTQTTPVQTCQFSGEGQIPDAQTTTTYPTPVTSGVPLIPTETKVWVDGNPHCITKYDLTSNNAATTRANQSCTLQPTGVKRTENNGRWEVTLNLSFLEHDTNTETYFHEAKDLAEHDVIVQVGSTPGSALAFRTRRWIPDAKNGEQDNESSLDFEGRCYGEVGEDELVVFVW